MSGVRKKRVVFEDNAAEASGNTIQASKKKFKFEKLKSRLGHSNISVRAAPALPEADGDSRDTSWSYFQSTVEKWSLLELDARFNEWVRQILPWSSTLPIVYYHRKKLLDAILDEMKVVVEKLEEAKDDGDQVTMVASPVSALCELLIALERDVGHEQLFKENYERVFAHLARLIGGRRKPLAGESQFQSDFVVSKSDILKHIMSSSANPQCHFWDPTLVLEPCFFALGRITKMYLHQTCQDHIGKQPVNKSKNSSDKRDCAAKEPPSPEDVFKGCVDCMMELMCHSHERVRQMIAESVGSLLLRKLAQTQDGMIDIILVYLFDYWQNMQTDNFDHQVQACIDRLYPLIENSLSLILKEAICGAGGKLHSNTKTILACLFRLASQAESTGHRRKPFNQSVALVMSSLKKHPSSQESLMIMILQFYECPLGDTSHEEYLQKLQGNTLVLNVLRQNHGYKHIESSKLMDKLEASFKIYVERMDHQAAVQSRGQARAALLLFLDALRYGALERKPQPQEQTKSIWKLMEASDMEMEIVLALQGLDGWLPESHADHLLNICANGLKSSASKDDFPSRRCFDIALVLTTLCNAGSIMPPHHAFDSQVLSLLKGKDEHSWKEQTLALQIACIKRLDAKGIPKYVDKLAKASFPKYGNLYALSVKALIQQYGSSTEFRHEDYADRLADCLHADSESLLMIHTLSEMQSIKPDVYDKLIPVLRPNLGSKSIALRTLTASLLAKLESHRFPRMTEESDGKPVCVFAICSSLLSMTKLTQISSIDEARFLIQRLETMVKRFESELEENETMNHHAVASLAYLCVGLFETKIAALWPAASSLWVTVSRLNMPAAWLPFQERLGLSISSMVKPEKVNEKKLGTSPASAVLLFPSEPVSDAEQLPLRYEDLVSQYQQLSSSSDMSSMPAMQRMNHELATSFVFRGVSCIDEKSWTDPITMVVQLIKVMQSAPDIAKSHLDYLWDNVVHPLYQVVLGNVDSCELQGKSVGRKGLLTVVKEICLLLELMGGLKCAGTNSKREGEIREFLLQTLTIPEENIQLAALKALIKSKASHLESMKDSLIRLATDSSFREEITLITSEFGAHRGSTLSSEKLDERKELILITSHILFGKMQGKSGGQKARRAACTTFFSVALLPQELSALVQLALRPLLPVICPENNGKPTATGKHGVPFGTFLAGNSAIEQPRLVSLRVQLGILNALEEVVKELGSLLLDEDWDLIVTAVGLLLVAAQSKVTTELEKEVETDLLETTEDIASDLQNVSGDADPKEFLSGSKLIKEVRTLSAKVMTAAVHVRRPISVEVLGVVLDRCWPQFQRVEISGSSAPALVYLVAAIAERADLLFILFGRMGWVRKTLSLVKVSIESPASIIPCAVVAESCIEHLGATNIVSEGGRSELGHGIVLFFKSIWRNFYDEVLLKRVVKYKSAWQGLLLRTIRQLDLICLEHQDLLSFDDLLYFWKHLGSLINGLLGNLETKGSQGSEATMDWNGTRAPRLSTGDVELFSKCLQLLGMITTIVKSGSSDPAVVWQIASGAAKLYPLLICESVYTSAELIRMTLETTQAMVENVDVSQWAVLRLTRVLLEIDEAQPASSVPTSRYLVTSSAKFGEVSSLGGSAESFSVLSSALEATMRDSALSEVCKVRVNLDGGQAYFIRGDSLLVAMYICLLAVLKSDLAVRGAAAHCLCLFSRFLSRCPVNLISEILSTEDKIATYHHEYRPLGIFHDLFLKARTFLIYATDISVRRELARILREFILAAPPGLSKSADLLRPLVRTDDPEVDFFENVAHLQIHRRSRALRRASKSLHTIEDSAHAQSLAHVFLYPLASRFLFMDNIEDYSAACLDLCHHSAKKLSWTQYRKVFSTVLRECTSILKTVENDPKERKLAAQKQALYDRLLIAVANAFSCNIVQMDKVNSVVTQAGSQKPDEEIPAMKANVPMARAQTFLMDHGIPKMISLVYTGENEKGNSEETFKPALAISSAYLIQFIDKEQADQVVPALATALIRGLVSREKRTRDTCRNCLVKVVTSLGSRYWEYMVGQITSKIPREGFRKYVDLGCLHTILVGLKELWIHSTEAATAASAVANVVDDFDKLQVPTENDAFSIGLSVARFPIDDAIRPIMDCVLYYIFRMERDIFDESVVRAGASENAYIKSCEIVELLGRFLTFPDHIASVLKPLSEMAVSDKCTDLKLTRKLQELFHRLAAGLTMNTTLINAEDAYRLLYTIISTYVPRCSMIEDRPNDLDGAMKSSPSISAKSRKQAQILSQFGLYLFNSWLAKERIPYMGESAKLLEPFLKYTHQALYCNQDEISTEALRLTSRLMRIPTLDSRSEWSDKFTAAILSLVAQTNAALMSSASGNASSSNAATSSELYLASIRGITAIMADTEGEINKARVLALLTMIQGVLLQGSRDAIQACLSLFRAIVSRKFLLPEVYKTVDLVLKQAFSSHILQIRTSCHSVILTFLLQYPLHERKLRHYISHIVRQLEYEHVDGRLAALSFIGGIIDRFPPEQLMMEAEFLFVPLVSSLSSEQNGQIREAVVQVMTKLLNKVQDRPKSLILVMIMTWWNSTNPSLRQASAQVTSIACGVEGLLDLGTRKSYLDAAVGFVVDSKSKNHVVLRDVLLSIQALIQNVNENLSVQDSLTRLWRYLCFQRDYELESPLSPAVVELQTIRYQLLWQHIQHIPVGGEHNESCLVSNMPGALREIMRHSCQTLELTDVVNESLGSILSTLLVRIMDIVSANPSLGKPVESGDLENDFSSDAGDIVVEEGEKHDGDSDVTNVPLRWLVRRLVGISTRRKDIKESTFFKRAIAFRILSMFLKSKSDYQSVVPYIPTIVHAVVIAKESQSDPAQYGIPQSMVNNQESSYNAMVMLSDSIHTWILDHSVNPNAYYQLYADTKEAILAARRQRKQAAASQIVVNPSVVAKRKLARLESKREKRKKARREKVLSMDRDVRFSKASFNPLQVNSDEESE